MWVVVVVFLIVGVGWAVSRSKYPLHPTQPPVALTPTLIRTYKGGQQADAVAAFRVDANELARSGYEPTSQSWAQGQWGCGAFAVALLLCIVLIGILIFIYMLVVKPEGTLTVTYVRKEPTAPPAIDPPADTQICPRCAETIKAAALVCRYCGHEFEISAT